jgi:spectinomycin phosphotransferase
VNDLPDGFDASALVRSLADGWGFEVESIDYAPVGFGSYHWVSTDVAGTRGFVTVDDLDRKPWFGDDREAAYDGLLHAFGTAVALRDAGLEFVVAPTRTSEGEPLRRIDARYSAALFPFVDGRAARHGAYDTPEQRAAVITMLARLHEATPAVESVARRIDLDLPGRRQLESGLEAVDRPWSGGPYSEPARQDLARHAGELVELLALFDRLADDVATRSADWVVTHGEPHAANLIRTGSGDRLIDWDTVALAPRERDLWMVMSETGDEGRAYAAATGREPDPVAIDLFRLTWDLGDLAAYVEVLRSPHRESEDTRKAYAGLQKCAAIRDQWVALLA